MRIRRAFTLFEIFLCVAILSLIGSLMGWQVNNMVATHHFRKSVNMVLTDLRKIQIMALSNRADIEMILQKRDGKYSYQITSDEPKMFQNGRETKLSGIDTIKKEGKEIQKTMSIRVLSTGRIDPASSLDFFSNQGEETGMRLDFKLTPTIQLRNLLKEGS